MRTWKWMLIAFLVITLSAMAQETTSQSPSAGAAQTSATQSAPAQPSATVSQPASTPTTTAQPAAAQSANPSAPPSASAPAASAAPAPPTTMDQVVDRAIAREEARMDMLTTRTPPV